MTGQTARDKAGNLVGRGDAAAQAEQVYQNVKAILQAAGASFSDVVLLDTHYKNREVADKVHKSGIREKYFGDHRPSTVALPVILPQGEVEPCA